MYEINSWLQYYFSFSLYLLVNYKEFISQL